MIERNAIANRFIVCFPPVVTFQRGDPLRRSARIRSPKPSGTLTARSDQTICKVIDQTICRATSPIPTSPQVRCCVPSDFLAASPAPQARVLDANLAGSDGIQWDLTGRTRVSYHIPTWTDGKHLIVHDKMMIIDERTINHQPCQSLSLQFQVSAIS
ncbi:hypothetical protein [Candidatus Binatus sp.]|uniref:hypothetical protein n=1 Tax=Candidatus Binatus sp. TaxID=2811406 RepID=UPI002F950C06